MSIATAKADGAAEPLRRALIVIALGLIAACSAGAPRGGADPGRAALLSQLKSCLALIDAGQPPQPNWPCLQAKLTPLNGIGRAELIAALGPATWCYGMPMSFPGPNGDCGAHWNPAWDFIAHRRTATGGDHDLICIADKTERCTRVVWSTPL